MSVTVDGSLLMGDLMHQVNEELQKSGLQTESSPVRLLSRLSFEEADESTTHFSVDHKNTSKNHDDAQGVTVTIFDDLFTAQHSSLWEGRAQSQSMRNNVSSCIGDSKSNADLSSVVRARVFSPVFDFLEGLRAYARDGSQVVPIGAMTVRTLSVVPLIAYFILSELILILISLLF